jgi:putative hydrolase of the HAD superfamily
LYYVLDLDDTVYLERDYVRSGFQAVDQWIGDHYGVTGFFELIWGLFEAGVRRHIFDRALDNKSIADPGIVEKLIDIYRSHDPDISLLPDAARFLKEKKQNDLAIITDGYSYAQWKKIGALELEKFVSKIIVTDDWGTQYWKPHLKAFQQIMKNRVAHECQYIADNPNKDFIGPACLGWAPSIRMRRKGGLHYDLESPDTSIEIASFAEMSN